MYFRKEFQKFHMDNRFAILKYLEDDFEYSFLFKYL